MARIAAFIVLSAILLFETSAQDVATQAVQQAGDLVDDLFHKNLPTPPPAAPVPSPSPSPSPQLTVPPTSTQYIPAPVIVTTPQPTAPPATVTSSHPMVACGCQFILTQLSLTAASMCRPNPRRPPPLHPPRLSSRQAACRPSTSRPMAPVQHAAAAWPTARA